MAEKTQYRMTWFPPDQSQVVKTGTKETIFAAARELSVWNPLVESRVPPEWEIVHEEEWKS